MSAFLVADETINRVVERLCLDVEKSPLLKEKLEDALWIDMASDQWYVNLGQVMFKLNSAGVNARYGEREAEHFREPKYAYKPAHGSEIQVLKFLQC